jgi:hypothetical protein
MVAITYLSIFREIYVGVGYFTQTLNMISFCNLFVLIRYYILYERNIRQKYMYLEHFFKVIAMVTLHEFPFP